MTCSCCSRRKFLGLALAGLFSGLPALAEKVHVVRKGETLSGLSRRYEVSLAELAQANDLTTKSKIQIGQRLIVPTPGDHPQISSVLQRQLDRTPVKKGHWKHIVVHHSASDRDTVAGMDRHHREVLRMENGLAYHFVIGNGNGMPDGEIAAAPRWTKQLAGGHLKSEQLNRISLGICLVGNFEERPPTSRQLRSLASLINYLVSRCQLTKAAVKTHRQINTVPTLCPGKRFPVKALLEMVA
jgi:LysM repeat protein